MENDTTNSEGFQFQANSTSAWDNELKLAAAGSVRTSIIVLASANVLVAFAVTVSILLRSWRTLRQNDSSWDFRSSWLRLVKGRDVYPFVLSLGIVVQGILYATAQSKGMDSLMILGCAMISQLMLPALFIVPFIQLIFGLELTMRVIKPNMFPFRGRFNTLGCLAIIGTLLLIVFCITFAVRPSEFCFADLFSYLHRYNKGCFGVLLTVILIVLVECGIICFKLHTGARMGIAERDEASRMVYFMVIAVISYTLQITYFFNTSFPDPLSASETTMELALIAIVVANLSGLLLGCLYLFLRSSRSPTGCSDGDVEGSKSFWVDDQDPGSPDPRSSMPRSLDLPKMVRKADSKEDLLGDGRVEDKVFGARKDILNRGLPRSLRLGSMRQSQNLPMVPKPARISSKESIKNFKKSMYSIFPKDEPPKSPIQLPTLPTTTYRGSLTKKAPAAQNPASGLLAPPALHVSDNNSRQSGASMISHATVQIGLRLSNFGDMRPPKPEPKQETNRVHNLDCPNSTVTFFPRKTSPLAIAIVDVPGEGTRYEIQDDFDKKHYSEKELPPVPLSAGMTTPPETTLSSAVYSPQRQKPGSSSHKPKSGSVSSTRIHSRQGSRAGPETRKGPWI
ncbi:hypothetical protein NW762_011757 [Fusarium torreyae]|uniref:Uncharacterized protein n=1 Tax=Fusarium torreyae TaxID=1237075 RepID=A0A9W8VA45_9HYPO|nr:hypothetical protein NW762_011757 [Fusarium torreyae]